MASMFVCEVFAEEIGFRKLKKKNHTHFHLFNKGKKSNGFLFQIFYGKLYYMLSKERTFASKKLHNSHHFRAKTETGLSI